LPSTSLGGHLTLADHLTISRMGYGAMQLAGPGVFGPPKDRDQALAVLRAAIDLGITHIDTSDFYGPVVNLRFGEVDGPSDEPIAEKFSALAELRQEGLIRHLGLSGVSSAQLTEAQAIAPVVTVQNLYNLAKRQDDDLVDRCAAENIAYASFFPLGGFTPLQSDTLTQVAARLEASPQQVALAWLLQRSATTVLIPGTSSVAHLHENVAAADLKLPADAVAELDTIGR